MNNITQRSISGTLIVILISVSIFFGEVGYFILFSIINIIALYEFSNMIKKVGLPINITMSIICGSLLLISGFCDVYWDYNKLYFVTAAVALCIAIVSLYGKHDSTIQNIALTFFSILYISIPFTLMYYIPSIFTEEWDIKIAFLPFLLVWTNDTFAYLSGVSFGKHKFFPSVSPNKSWEGAIGGAIFTIIVSVLIADYTGLSILEQAIMAIIVVVFGNYGDLIESLFKRSVGIKDSGSLIPGHGGILDRMDSILYVLPAIYIFFKIIE